MNTHCRNGHLKTPETWRKTGNSVLRCITCKRAGEPNRKCKMRYGITHKQRDQMIVEQDNKCAICRVEFGEEVSVGPEVDHCHASEQVRGILCHACNVLLGAAKDSIATLAAAIQYLS